MLSEGRENGHRTLDFHVAGENPTPNDLSLALHVDPTTRELFSLQHLLSMLYQRAVQTRRRGMIPTMCVDLDNTLFDARLYAGILFDRWLKSYEGMDAETIRERATKLPRPIRGWNNTTILESLQIYNPRTIELAQSFYDERFHSTERSLTMPLIQGVANLVRMSQQWGIRTVFNTLRSDQEDVLSDGSSASRKSLVEHNLWRKNSFLKRHHGNPVKFDHEKLPNKALWADQFVAENPRTEIIACIDDCLIQLHNYLAHFGTSISSPVIIHVEGSRLPGTEKQAIPIGVYSIRENTELEHLRWPG
jgi:hypothetical protein